MDKPPAEIKLANQTNVLKAKISSDFLNALKHVVQQGRYLLNDDAMGLFKEARRLRSTRGMPHTASCQRLDMAEHVIPRAHPERGEAVSAVRGGMHASCSECM